MVLLSQESRLLTGSADSELRAWDINYLEEVRKDTAEHFFLFLPQLPFTEKRQSERKQTVSLLMCDALLSMNMSCFVFCFCSKFVIGS